MRKFVNVTIYSAEDGKTEAYDGMIALKWPADSADNVLLVAHYGDSLERKLSDEQIEQLFDKGDTLTWKEPWDGRHDEWTVKADPTCLTEEVNKRKWAKRRAALAKAIYKRFLIQARTLTTAEATRTSFEAAEAFLQAEKENKG